MLIGALKALADNSVVNTAQGFGSPDVTTSAMNAAIKEMTAGKTGYSIALTCLCGGLLLFGWAFISTR